MKNKILRGIGLTLISVMVCTSVLTGCSSKKDSKDVSAGKDGDLKPVKLTWIINTKPQKDTAEVQAKMNEIIKKKINAEVELVQIDGGAYNDKMRTTIAAGEDFDLCFTAHWSNDFFGNVGKGAFLPLNDLVQKYAPKTYASLPKDYWKAVTVNKNIYGVPNYQISVTQKGIIMQKPMAEKYGVNLDSIKTLEDLEPIMAKMKASEPKDTVLFPLRKTGIWEDYTDKFEFLGNSSIPGWVVSGDKDLKVINQYETPEFKQHIATMRDWYTKGYINKDAATLTDFMPLLKTGKAPIVWSDIKPGGAAARKVQMGGIDVVEKPMFEPYVNTNSIAASLTAINKKSKNPERAMMLIELMNTDKELYNLMCFGEEGKHYTKDGDNRIKLVDNSGYYPDRAWAYGNQFNAYLIPGQDNDVWDKTKKLNESGKPNATLGFAFNAEPVKAEVAQVQSVIDEYKPGLVTGQTDPNVYLPKFLEKLKTAGVDKIIAEKQKQLDEWKKTK